MSISIRCVPPGAPAQTGWPAGQRQAVHVLHGGDAVPLRGLVQHHHAGVGRVDRGQGVAAGAAQREVGGGLVLVRQGGARAHPPLTATAGASAPRAAVAAAAETRSC
ncbi:MAG: hypothetical protein WDN04_00640 [Rhodospirillales bacterium]